MYRLLQASRSFSRYLPKNPVEVKDNRLLVYCDLKPTRRFNYMLIGASGLLVGTVSRLAQFGMGVIELTS
jgi:hypothetical protein